MMLLLQIQTQHLLNGIIESFIYSIIGLLLAVLAYKVIDWITPGDLAKQIAEEKNVALAILVGALILGVCIIIATALV